MKFGAAPVEETNAMVGKSVIVRTVTLYYTGRVESLTNRWLVLEDCAWIADTGQWTAALKDGELDQVSPYPDGGVWINVGAVVDISEWNHKLPR